MIDQSTFLKMPLRTTSQRRRLVLLYYLFLAAITLPALYRPLYFPWVLIAQTVTLGGMLGGIQHGGPVKPFSEPIFPLDGGPDRPLEVLNLNGNARREWNPLDEREQVERDHAHYVAYRILRWALTALALLFWLGTAVAPRWIAATTPVLLWILVVLVLSLPQSVVLWTEAPELEP